MGQFSLDLSRLAEKAKGNTQFVVRKVMLELFTRTVMKTPVDTGLARNSWFTGNGAIPAPKSGAPNPSGSDSITRISVDIGELKIEGQTIYLINNLPYIQNLEYGGSKQAPQGMVRLSIQEIIGKYGA